MYRYLLEDGKTYLQGDIEESDASFDHEFGTQRIIRHDVVEFRIFYEHRGKFKDLTSWVLKHSPKLYEELEESFINKCVDYT